jgi:hypothetical protein
MVLDDYSAKRIAYTAASQLWNANSDVVLMATNRIQRDLTSSKPLIVSVVLSSLPPSLSPSLSQHIASDVIKMMTSSKEFIQVKAIMAFYHLCLHHSTALKEGFPTLRTLLDNPRRSVVLATLTVLLELYIANPQNFIQMIPKNFKMLEGRSDIWITIRIVQILTVLASVETRLPKKLIQPFSDIIDSSSSDPLIYEVCRSMIQIRLIQPSVMQITIHRLQGYINAGDQDVRFLFLTVFMGLLKLSPKAALQNRELIGDCLDSEDENQRLIALELLASMTNSKNIDKIFQ